MSLPASIARIIHNRENSESKMCKASLILLKTGSTEDVPSAYVGRIKKNQTIPISATIFIVVGLSNVLMIFFICIDKKQVKRSRVKYSVMGFLVQLYR